MRSSTVMKRIKRSAENGKTNCKLIKAVGLDIVGADAEVIMRAAEQENGLLP